MKKIVSLILVFVMMLSLSTLVVNAETVESENVSKEEVLEWIEEQDLARAKIDYVNDYKYRDIAKEYIEVKKNEINIDKELLNWKKVTMFIDELENISVSIPIYDLNEQYSQVSYILITISDETVVNIYENYAIKSEINTVKYITYFDYELIRNEITDIDWLTNKEIEDAVEELNRYEMMRLKNRGLSWGCLVHKVPSLFGTVATIIGLCDIPCSKGMVKTCAVCVVGGVVITIASLSYYVYECWS